MNSRKKKKNTIRSSKTGADPEFKLYEFNFEILPWVVWLTEFDIYYLYLFLFSIFIGFVPKLLGSEEY